MRVERYNYNSQLGEEWRAVVEQIGVMLTDGRYILTDEVRNFEMEFAAYLGAKHVRGVNSGTDALMIALLASGVKPGDEVITQANTFYATVAAIRLIRARPVLVDADESSYLIDERQIEAAITPQTRVLLPVHLYGKPTPMRGLLAMAGKYGLHVIEDACQAHGARIEGRPVGTFGTAGCFSFHPSKNLAAAGDAGAVVTDDAPLDESVRRHRELGQASQNRHILVGLNSKLDAIQALVLSKKLPRLDGWNLQRRRMAMCYRERLAGLPLDFQSTNRDEQHVYHLFQVRTACRDQLLAHLQAAGVDAVIRYPQPIHLQTAFADCGWRDGQFPVAERLSRELLSLPIRPDMPMCELDFVADQVRAFFRG
jgi:dTDP-4-amino-4,6-dideoxygalactose transaminase